MRIQSQKRPDDCQDFKVINRHYAHDAGEPTRPWGYLGSLIKSLNTNKTEHSALTKQKTSELDPADACTQGGQIASPEAGLDCRAKARQHHVLPAHLRHAL